MDNLPIVSDLAAADDAVRLDVINFGSAGGGDNGMAVSAPAAADIAADVPAGPAIDRRGCRRAGFDGHIGRKSGRSDQGGDGSGASRDFVHSDAQTKRCPNESWAL
jgi:hypothetical protein